MACAIWVEIGVHPEPHLGQAEQRIGRGEGDIGAADKTAAAAKTRAMHHRDGGAGKLVQQLHRPGGGHRGLERLLRCVFRGAGQPVDVGAGLEMRPAPRNTTARTAASPSSRTSPSISAASMSES